MTRCESNFKYYQGSSYTLYQILLLKNLGTLNKEGVNSKHSDFEANCAATMRKVT